MFTGDYDNGPFALTDHMAQSHLSDKAKPFFLDKMGKLIEWLVCTVWNTCPKTLPATFQNIFSRISNYTK